MALFRSNPTRRHGARSSRALWLLAVVAAVGVTVTSARGQTAVGPSQVQNPGGIQWHGTDVGWDPVNKVFLLVAGNGPIAAIFLNPSGQAVGTPFAIMDGTGERHGQFPKVTYSPHLNNGAGGFLVTWHHNVVAVNPYPNAVHARVVAYSPSTPSRSVLLSGIQQISDGAG